MAKLPVKEIERLIYPVSFYRNKAEHVKACCQMLVDRFGGRVPPTMEELVTLPGVGRKTANLVLILGVQEPAEHLRRHARAPHLEPPGLGARPTLPEETEQALYRSTDRAVVAATSTCIW